MRKRFAIASMLAGCMFVVTAILASISCASPLDTPDLGYVTVDFSTGGGSSRAAGALPVDIKSVVISVKADDMDAITVTLTAPALTATLDVPAGASRQFEVVAKDAAGIPLYHGKETLTIEAGTEQALSVTMRTLYKLLYDSSDASSGTVPETLYRATTDVVTVAPNSGLLVKTGFTFGGWYTLAGGVNTAYAAGANLTMPAGDVVLYAKWDPLSSAKDITAFSFALPGATGVISGTDISVTVPFGTNVTSLSPVVTHTGTGISPALDSAIDFSAAVTFIVAAADSTTKTYTVTVTIAPSSNASLAVGGLIVSGVTLNPGFSPAVVSYTATVSSSIPSVTVTPTKADAGGSIQVQINGGGYSLETSGSPTGALPLNSGSNTIEILVTAADSTTKVYTVTVSKKVSLTINYASGGTGTPIGMLEYVPGEPISLNVIPNAGYTFAGWTGDISNIAAPTLINTVMTMPLTSATINATFTPISYTISYDAQGGTPTPASYPVNFGTSYMTPPGATRAGYSFDDWWTGPNGTGIRVIGGTLVTIPANHSIYANWIPDFAGGTGTEPDPYLVSNITQLKNMNYFRSSFFKLTAPINLSSETNWLPIGDAATKFTGGFDGMDLILSNLTINSSSIDRGLFGFVQGAVIKNVQLTGINIATTTDNAGGLIGRSLGATSITDCSVTGTINGYQSIGGLLGCNDDTGVITILRCWTDVNITTVFYGVIGGLVGTSKNGSITQSYALGSIGYSGGNPSAIGGLVGMDRDTSITDCYAMGNVSGDMNVGGLVGYMDMTSVVLNCYSTGSVTAASFGGGLVGQNSGAAVNESFYDMTTSGMSDALNGTPYPTAQMQTGTTFSGAGWDFATLPVWKILALEYPKLNWQP